MQIKLGVIPYQINKKNPNPLGFQNWCTYWVHRETTPELILITHL